MVLVTMSSPWFMFCFCSEVLWVIAGTVPSRRWGRAWEKRADEGIKPGIFQMHSDYQSKKNTCRTIYVHLSQISIMHWTTSAVSGPFSHWNQYEKLLSIRRTRAIHNIYDKLLSFWRNMSLPKSIVTLWTQTFKMSFEKACLSAVISSILRVLYGVLSSGTFPNAAEPFSTPLY